MRLPKAKSEAKEYYCLSFKRFSLAWLFAWGEA
jgi:hypothetical protein